MSRSLVATAAAGVLIVAAVVAVATGLVGGDERGGRPPARTVSATASVSPETALFGDLVTARAEIVVDAGRVDADGVSVEGDFTPFAVVGPPRRTSASTGDTTSVTYRFELLCLTEACVAAGDAKRVELREAQVRVPLRDGGSADVALAWPPVNFARRIPAAEFSTSSDPRWRLQTELPPVTYGVDPGRLGFVLALVSALLAAAGLALAAWELERYRRLRLRRVEARSLLEYTLDLVRQSTARGADDRRKALALLARVLAREPRDGRHAGTAERLAWSRPDPSPAGVEALADEVERESQP